MLQRATDPPVATIEEMAAYHGRAHVRVAEEHLTGAYVVSVLEQICGERTKRCGSRSLLIFSGWLIPWKVTNRIIQPAWALSVLELKCLTPSRSPDSAVGRPRDSNATSAKPVTTPILLIDTVRLLSSRVVRRR